MIQAWNDLKSFVTIAMTLAMVGLLFIPYEVNKEVLMLFSTSYGAIITFFFTKNKNNDKEEK